MSKLVLCAKCETRKGSRKCHVVSDVIISVREEDAPAGRIVATMTLGGEYNEFQALKEFRRDPTRFKPFGRATIQELGLFAKC